MDFTATYTWDNMGRMTDMNYPLNGPQVAMNYDAMSNLSSETATTCQTWDPNQNWVCQTWYNPATLATATYNFAGQMTALRLLRFLGGAAFVDGNPHLQRDDAVDQHHQPAPPAASC